QARNAPPAERRAADRDGPPPAARRAEVEVRRAGLLRRLAADAVAESGARVLRPEGEGRAGVEDLRAPVPRRDEQAGGRAAARSARRAVAPDPLLDRLLLRGRGAVSPVRAAHAPGRARRCADLTTGTPGAIP